MKRIFKSMLAFIVVFTWFLGSSVMADHGTAYEGRKLFATYCYLCHGSSGKGDGPLASKMNVPPANLTDPSRMEKRTDADLLGIIQGADHQLVTTEMPKWGKLIPEPQIRSLVAYVRFLHRSKNPLIGDAEAGKRIYDDHCATCHGKKGKGDGVMMSIVPIKPADHTNPAHMDKMTNEELVNIVANGKGEKSFMPPWKGILSQSEIESVVGYVRFLSH